RATLPRSRPRVRAPSIAFLFFEEKESLVNCAGDFFCMIGKLFELPYHTKKPSGQDRTAAEWKMSLMRPAAGGESREAGFFIMISVYDGKQDEVRLV
ncbi:MAG: hypothetical protein Q4B70_16435, partial [Lachnospiraceae bacterium]|nr:hypothetical protein [Lachnospiraceae bacterium]